MLRYLLRSYIQCSLVPHPFKLVAWAVIKFFKIQAPSEFTVKLPNGETLNLKGTDTHFQILFWWGVEAHEYDTVKVLWELSKISRTFWDVGAYFGQYSLFLSKANPELKTVAFEPAPDSYEKFMTQIKLNHLDQKIQVRQQAISDKAGTLEFYINKKHSTTSSLTPKSKEGTEVVKVDVTTLDQAMDDSPVDLVKVDVERNELNVLKGMVEMLRSKKPLIVIEILSSFPSEQAEKILPKSDYSYFYITSDGLVPMSSLKKPAKKYPWRWKQRTPFYNFLLCPNEKVAEIQKLCKIL